MKNDDTFSENEIPSTSVPERGVDSDDHALLPPHNVAPGSSSSTQLSRKEQRLTSRRHMRLILAALTVVMLVALAGGYGVFRVVW
jgi:hypothetical protein